MEISPAVFVTDQVNRTRMRIPAAELMGAYQRDFKASIRTGIELGLPLHMQHDMHRLVGWSRSLGLYIDGSMVRFLGQIEMPTQDEERAKLNLLVDRYWNQYHSEGTEPFGENLKARLEPANLDGSRLLLMEAAVVSREGIASQLYPDLFTPGCSLVDKDGLTDYHDLNRRMKQIQPGIFHDAERDVLLFAHRFFRRSLSHRNKLNTYFLQSLDNIANQKSLRVRLKLDPDIIGYPSSAKHLIEMEYWRGPKFDDDIEIIPSGVAEHKNEGVKRHYSGIDRTHIWWKDPETRESEGEIANFRTFEIEELIENESCGLGADKFGCRYAHSEYSLGAKAITHFDGAIRAYDAKDYFVRIDTSIDKAGKHSEYTKLFRIDGELSISNWKCLLSDYFQGNQLIPEYLGAPEEPENLNEPMLSEGETVPSFDETQLAVFISLDRGSFNQPLAMYPELSMRCGNNFIPFIEIGSGAVGAYLQNLLELEEFTSVGFEDGILNMSRLCFGAGIELKEVLSKVAIELSAAVQSDIDAGLLKLVSLPFSWCINELLVTLTIAGDASLVVSALRKLPDVINTSHEPSEWCEAISSLVKQIAPQTNSSVMWDGTKRGVLSIGRSGHVKQRIQMPEELRRTLVESGSLKIHNQ